MAISSSSNPIALFTAPSPTSPLLTRFTVPSTCSTKWYSVDYPYTNSPATFASGYNTALGKGCALHTVYESRVDRTSITQRPVVYSPGVCPDSYLPVSTITIGPFQGVNTSICGFEGLSYISTGVHNGNCGGTVTSSSMTLSNYPNPQHTGPNQTVVNSFYFLDLAYTVAWASNQLDKFTPASLPLAIASEARAKGIPDSASASPSASRSGTSDGSSSGSSKDLSVGAQAGIGVAAAVVGVAIGALIMWYFIRRRSRRQAQTQLTEIEGREDEKRISIPSIPELSAKEGSVEVPADDKPQELFVEAGQEVEPDRAASEADNDDMRHELDAGYRGEQLDDVATPVDGLSPIDEKKHLD